jgi:RNA polymerase sigma-70 factor (ECF subfamily)
MALFSLHGATHRMTEPYRHKEIHDVDIDQLIKGCRNNHRASQQRLFAHFYNYAMSIARRYMGDSETAEEVVSDAFFKVFTKIHLFSDGQPFRPWLRRVLVNTAIDRLRSNMAMPPETNLEVWHDVGTLTGIEESLTKEQIWGMLDRLPPAYRTVFNLAVVDGFSHEEIAETLQISIGSSKSNLSRARQHLKTILKNEFEYF